MRSASATGPTSEFFASLEALRFWVEFAALSFGVLLFRNKGNGFFAWFYLKIKSKQDCCGLSEWCEVLW